MVSKFFFFASIFLAEIAIISATSCDIVPRESATSQIICSKDCNSCQLEDGKEVICDFSALKLFDTGSIAVLRAEFIKEKNMYAIRFFSKIDCVDINEPKRCSPLVPKEVEDASKYFCSIPKKPSLTRYPRHKGHRPISPRHHINKAYWKKYKTRRELSQSADLKENLPAPWDNLSILQRQVRNCKAVAVAKYTVSAAQLRRRPSPNPNR